MGSKYGGIYWCDNCNVPLLTMDSKHEAQCEICGSEGRYCAFDMKPLFEQERKLLESKLSVEVPMDSFMSQTRVINAGETLFRLGVKEGELYLKESPPPNKAEYRNYGSPEEYWETAIEANRQVLNQLESQSLKIIAGVANRKEYKDHEKLVLFSGGKDSAIVARLVTEAIGDVPLFYADTTIESPATIQYAKDFASNYDLDLSIKSPSQTFFELCSRLEPPSKFIRWCCTTSKVNPASRFIQEPTLCFDGVRACESRSRRGYPVVQQHRKIANQVTVHPLLHGWFTLAVWLYTIDKEIPVNPEYYRGQNRVGCVVCPFNAIWDEFLLKLYHPTMWNRFAHILQEYARERQLSEDWVTNDKWKYRRPSSSTSVAATERDISVLSEKREGMSKIVLNHPLPSDAIMEFMKPFGEFIEGPDGYVFQSPHDKYSVILNVEAQVADSIQIDTSPTVNGRVGGLVTKQLKKALNCVGCGGCIGVCPNYAITVSDAGHFRIDEEKCSHCLKCVTDNFVERGCLALMSKSDIQIVSKQ